jgi:TPR repeat protein
MSVYAQLPGNELDALVKKEDPDALCELAVRFKNERNAAQARKFFTLAAYLGNARACAELGGIYEEDGNAAAAVRSYRRAFSYGDTGIACKLASLMMDFDESGAAELLTSAAVTGDVPSIKMLEEYYRGIGEADEAEYWRKRLGD